MAYIQQLSNLFDQRIKKEASNSLSFLETTSYSNLFKGKLPNLGEINLNHSDFPLPSLQNLSVVNAEQQIMDTVKKYHQKGFWGRLWWRIISSESIDHYQYLYNILTLRNLKREFQDTLERSNTGLSCLIDIFSKYLSSFLPIYDNINQFFQEHFMQALLELWLLSEGSSTQTAHRVVKAPGQKKNTEIKNQLTVAESHLKSGEELLASGVDNNALAQWIEEINDPLNAIIKEELSEENQLIYQKIVDNLSAISSILSCLTQQDILNSLAVVEAKEKPGIDKQFNLLKANLKKIEYGYTVYTVEEESLDNYKFLPFTYVLETDKKGKFKSLRYYGKDSDNPQMIPMEKVKGLLKISTKSNRLLSELEDCILAYHQKQISINSVQNPIQQMRALYELNPERVADELVYTYSIQMVKKFTKKEGLAQDYARKIVQYKAYVAIQKDKFMILYKAAEERLGEQKRCYTEAKKFVNTASQECKKIAIDTVFNASGKSESIINKELADLIKKELFDPLEKNFESLSSIVKQQLLLEINHFCLVLAQVYSHEQRSSGVFQGFFGPKISPWNQSIAEAFQGFDQLKMENYEETVKNTAVIKMLSIIDEQPQYSEQLCLAFEEIKKQMQDKLSVKSSHTPRKPQPLPNSVQAERDTSSPMPENGDENDWRQWLFKVRKDPKNLKKNLDDLVQHIQNSMRNPKIDLLLYAILSQLALNWVETVKWKPNEFKLRVEEAAETAKKIITDIGKKVLAMRYHPDKNPGCEQEVHEIITAAMKEKDSACNQINAAIDSLKCPDWISDNDGSCWENFELEHNKFMGHVSKMFEEQAKINENLERLQSQMNGLEVKETNMIKNASYLMRQVNSLEEIMKSESERIKRLYESITVETEPEPESKVQTSI